MDNGSLAAASIAEYGMQIGTGPQALFTGGASDWEAPKVHPVWAPELAHEARTLERMGEATFTYEPTYQQLQEWADAGKPQIDAADDYQDEMDY